MAGDDDRLPGGWMSGARLVRGRIHRTVGAHTPFVHELLGYLEQAGFTGAPRVIGTTDGTEILSYFDGHVPVEVDRAAIHPIVFSDRGIQSAFELIARYHDLTAACPLRGDHEVVCHGDLSPWNTVYDDGGAIAFIDWDNAAPGPRRGDVGNAVWRYLMLGFPDAPPLEAQARWLALTTDVLGRWERDEILTFVAEAQDDQLRQFEQHRLEGEPRYLRLIELGALRYIEGAQSWLRQNRDALLG